MHEIDVIRQGRHFLQRHGLLGRRVLDLYTDAHPSLLADPRLEPFQRFTLQFDSFATHPDLVGRLDDGGTTFAVGAKGSSDWLKGIAQADTYRQGFHAALIALAGSPSDDTNPLKTGRMSRCASETCQLRAADRSAPTMRCIQNGLVDMRAFARQRGVGIMVARPNGAELIEAPPLHLPQLRLAEHVRSPRSTTGPMTTSGIW